MTTRTRHHAAALFLALATTLAMLSGIGSLSQPSPATAVWAQAQTGSPQT